MSNIKHERTWDTKFNYTQLPDGNNDNNNNIILVEKTREKINVKCNITGGCDRTLSKI